MDGPDEAVKQEAPADDAAAGGNAAAEAAEAPQQQEPAAEAAPAVKEENAGEQLEAPPPAAAPLEPANEGMMLGADDGGLVGASGQRISAAEIQLVQNLVERCLQARAPRGRTLVTRGSAACSATAPRRLHAPRVSPPPPNQLEPRAAGRWARRAPPQRIGGAALTRATP